MESDERFKHLASDPRFKNLKKKQRKVQIDDRFKSMFTDERFTLKYSRDKRGHKRSKKPCANLKQYYALENEEKGCGDVNANSDDTNRIVDTERGSGESEDSSDQEEGNKPQESEDESSSDEASIRIKAGEEQSDDGGVNDEEEDDLADEETKSISEVSSSSDESESGEDDDDDMLHIQHDWMPLDHDAEKADRTSRRLAIQNMDWDRINVQDLYTLINSVRPPRKVCIYLSEYGKDRLKREEIEGPQEIVEMPKVDELEQECNELKDKLDALNNPANRKKLINQYEDADEELNPKDEVVRERIRKYQLNRMKYYYAIAEFDSIESAELVYKELDGIEFEGSSLEVDLRYVPDDLDFDAGDLIAECSKAPDLATYKAPQFINTALQQTTVKFTWDQTDLDRQEKLRKSYTMKELEMDDLDAYLASGTSSEEEEDDVQDADDSISVVTTNSEARINKYRQLIKCLDEESASKKKVDVDIDWDGEHDEEEEQSDDSDGDRSLDEQSELDGDHSNIVSDMASDADSQSDSSGDLDEKSAGKNLSKREMRKLIRKAKRKERRKEKRDPGNRMKSKEPKNEPDVELDLLVMGDENKRLESFQFNPEDDRFKAVYESALYNIDPSHPNFKRTKAFDMMAEKKREKRVKKS